MDITFTISDPTLKSGTVLKYTSYKIISTTRNGDSNSSSTKEVQRRYSHFLWLHETLRIRNSGCIIPPLPKKKFLGRFHPQFIENRIRGMEKFLSKVLTHPVLSQELYVHTFLETNDITQAQKIAESCRNSGENNTGVMDWLQTQKNVLTASENSMVKSQVMVETENRISPILDHMANAVKHAPKALACSENYLQKQQKSTATLWQKRAEASLALYQVDTSATGAAASMQQFSTAELALASITESHIQSVQLEVMEPLQRHTATVLALRASVTSQRNKRANHIAANSAIQRDSVRNPNHEELVAKASRCLNEYVDASNRLDEDYQRYQEERADELLLLLHSLATLQMNHCQHLQVVWTDLEASLVADTQLSPIPFTNTTTNTDTDTDTKTSSWSPPSPSSFFSQPATSLSQQPPSSSSLLDLEEEDEDEDEGRESDFYESV